MYALVMGTFEAQNQAIAAERALLHSCVPSDRVSTILPGSRKSLARCRAGGGRVPPALSASTILPGSRKRLARFRADGGRVPHEPGGIVVAVKALDNVCQALALK